MSTYVRRATVADALALAEFAARIFRDTFAADNRPEELAIHIAQAFGSAQQNAELIDPHVATLLAEGEGALVGYAQLRAGSPPACVTASDPLELWRFYLDRPWQGRGVVQTLMGHVLTEAARRGGASVWLGVWEHNPRAIAFYRKLGFRDVGPHVFMVGADAQTDRIMVRSVGAG